MFKKKKKILFYIREAYWYFIQIFIKRKSYQEYYAFRMNKLVNPLNTKWGLLNKKYQLEFLKSYGLKKNMDFLDYGCGAINAGRYFIEYLDEKKYTGVDISFNVIETGKKRVQEYNLTAKKPCLIHIKNMKKMNLSNKSFDIVWGQSVLTHMPPEDLNLLLIILKNNLNKNLKILLTFVFDKNGPLQKNFKDWYYSYESIEKIARDNEYKVKFPKNWPHPDSTSKNDKLVEFSQKI